MKVFANHPDNDNTNFLFNLLSPWFRHNDSYKSIEEPRGLLERFYEALCLELDEGVMVYIDNLPKLKSVHELKELDGYEYLINHIQELFDIPENDTNGQGTPEFYNLLTYFIHIIKTRGSIKSLKLYLNIHGYEIVDLTTHVVMPNIYDDEPEPLKYDDGEIYDKAAHNFYAPYDLTITDYPGTGPHNPSTDYLNKMKEILNGYINPFYSPLENINYV